jgi:hypothetical protein
MYEQNELSTAQKIAKTKANIAKMKMIEKIEKEIAIANAKIARGKLKIKELADSL